MNDYSIGNLWTQRFQITEFFMITYFPWVILLDWRDDLRWSFDDGEVFSFYDIETRSLKNIPLKTSTGYINGFSSFM